MNFKQVAEMTNAFVESRSGSVTIELAICVHALLYNRWNNKHFFGRRN
jgi:hypothetical protein